MSSPFTEVVLLRLTRQEYQLLVELTEVREVTLNDVLRELLGLRREEELALGARPRLRLVSTSSDGPLEVAPGA